MKSIAIQYYEAMNRIQQNTTLLRDVYMIITPDKISGSLNGIALFAKTEEFKAINVGVALDVGIPTPTSEIQIVNQDKTQCIIQLDCYGEPIHSAFLPDVKTTAADPCGRFFVGFTQFREEQYRLSLESEDSSEYTAANLIGVKGVTPYRIVPSHFRYFYVAYLAHNTSIADFNRTVRGWVPEGENVKISVYYEATRSATTKADNTNPYWVAIEEAFKELNITVRPSTIPTTTDAKFIVEASIPTFGISPQRFTVPLIGGVNERLSITVFNEGIRIYQKIIPHLANLPKDKIAEDPGTYLIQPTII
ncbi:PREDICTED: aminoacylase-1A-like [Papilio polytes]